MFGFLEESSSVNKNGVGLGLVISKQITQQFEGDITIDSELGVGSTFPFQFKLNPPPPVEDKNLENESQINTSKQEE